MRKLLGFIIVFILFLSAFDRIYAASVELSGIPTSVEKDSEFEINTIVVGAASNTSNYLRVAFFAQSAATSYFGYTFNHLNEWYNGTPSPIDPHRFLQIQISEEGSWSGKLKAKVDLSSTFFKGGGTYSVKVGRYTAGGSSITDWSNENQILINAPIPTPTPHSIPPTKVITSTKSPTAPPTQKTATPVITKPSTPFPTSRLNTSLTPKSTELESSAASILGISSKAASFKVKKIPAPSKSTARVLGVSNTLPSVMMMVGGGIFILACGILAFQKFKKRKL